MRYLNSFGIQNQLKLEIMTHMSRHMKLKEATMPLRGNEVMNFHKLSNIAQSDEKFCTTHENSMFQPVVHYSRDAGPLADPEGTASACPPTGSNSFIFAFVFVKNRMHRRSVAPPWEILDPPLRTVHGGQSMIVFGSFS